jgi:hypothetical protein
MKTRLQSLGLLDRAFRATTDDELAALVAGLGDDHREALERLVADGQGGQAGAEATPEAIRAAVHKGRMNGEMESIAMLLTDAALTDCIEKLGDHADNPTSEQLTEVLPGVVERHGLAVTRMMLASTVAGEAAASVVIRELLKNDELVKLPKEEPRRIVPAAERNAEPDVDPEREALKAKRAEAKRRKQEAAAQRRKQSAEARGRG